MTPLLILMTALATTWDPIAADGFNTSCPYRINSAWGTRTRIPATDVGYGINPQGFRFGSDFSEYDNIWGFNNAFPSSIVVPWPGVSGSSPYFSMSRVGYFGARFTTTEAPTAPGYFIYGNYGGSIPISISISRACGDFNGDPSVNACYVSNHPSDDGTTLRWQFGTGISPYRCYLQPDTEYYLNVMFTDPHPTDPNLAQKCASASSVCTVLLKSMGH